MKAPIRLVSAVILCTCVLTRPQTLNAEIDLGQPSITFDEAVVPYSSDNQIVSVRIAPNDGVEYKCTHGAGFNGGYDAASGKYTGGIYISSSGQPVSPDGQHFYEGDDQVLVIIDAVNGDETAWTVDLHCGTMPDNQPHCYGACS